MWDKRMKLLYKPMAKASPHLGNVEQPTYYL